MPVPSSPSRDRDLAAVRSAYDRYRREGRGRIWDVRNPGFARIVRDRNARVVELLEQSLPTSGGRVADLGSGDGSTAVLARAAGLPLAEWIGIDLDQDAVNEAAASAPWATFICASADRLPLENASVHVALASTLFSSLPSLELEQSVAREVARVLIPGGWLVWYDLRYGNPRNPAVHGITGKELKRMFPDWHRELRTFTLLPPVARRLGPTTPIIYPMLELIPTLRSHLIGRLRRPTP